MEKKPHILLTKEQVCKYAILPGDPARIDRIAKFLQNVEELEYNREFRSVKGSYKGIDILLVSTGIGGPSTAIVVEELSQLGVSHMIRIGSCGALQKAIQVGDLILVNGAVRDEGTSKAYVADSFPAVADYQLLQACVEAAKEEQITYHIGMARSHDSFYIDEKADIYSFWKKKGILGSDMETAALYVVGALRGIKCASILNVVVADKENLQNQINQYTDGKNRAQEGEQSEILTALEAFVRIEKENCH